MGCYGSHEDNDPVRLRSLATVNISIVLLIARQASHSDTASNPAVWDAPSSANNPDGISMLRVVTAADGRAGHPGLVRTHRCCRRNVSDGRPAAAAEPRWKAVKRR